MRKIFFALMLTIVAICNCAFAMTVKVLNVGQGDAVLIQTGEQNVLIDTSDIDERAKLRQELYKADCYRIDKLILTHAHADHIANAAWLIQNGIFSVRAVYDNGKISDNKSYKNYLNALRLFRHSTLHTQHRQHTRTRRRHSAESTVKDFIFQNHEQYERQSTVLKADHPHSNARKIGWHIVKITAF